MSDNVTALLKQYLKDRNQTGFVKKVESFENENANLRLALTILTKLMIGDEENPEGKLGYLEHDLVDPSKGMNGGCESNCLKCYSEKSYDVLMAMPEFESLYTKLYKGNQ